MSEPAPPPPRLPPVLWLGARPGFQQWDWTRGVLTAHQAGVVHQLLVVVEDLPRPSLDLGGKVEVLDLGLDQVASRAGMLGTLQLGLEALGERHPGPAFVALASRPGAGPDTYASLAEVLGARDCPAVKPKHGAKHGHPILLSAAARARALELDPGENELRVLLEGALSVEVDDPGIHAGLGRGEA